MAKIYFIGAGPGDPELITIKGQRIIAEAMQRIRSYPVRSSLPLRLWNKGL